MALANLDLALGNNANKGLITDLLSANSANNFIYDRYLDDSGPSSLRSCPSSPFPRSLEFPAAEINSRS